MPSRNLVYEAIALRSREIPSGARVVTLMTAESGIVDVFLFGGSRSKLRSLAAPYVSGRAFVYLDPVKDFRKLSDFEARDFFPGLREDLGRLWSAGLVAELLVKTSGGGGDFPQALELTRRCLSALEAAPAGHNDPPLLSFLWRFLSLIGLGPDSAACTRCGRALGAPAAGEDLVRGAEQNRPCGKAAYSYQSEGFVCPACLERARRSACGHEGSGRDGGEAGRERLVPLGQESLRWLESCGDPDGAEAALACGDSIEELKTLLFDLARRAVDPPLDSFKKGALPD